MPEVLVGKYQMQSAFEYLVEHGCNIIRDVVLKEAGIVRIANDIHGQAGARRENAIDLPTTEEGLWPASQARKQGLSLSKRQLVDIARHQVVLDIAIGGSALQGKVERVLGLILGIEIMPEVERRRPIVHVLSESVGGQETQSTGEALVGLDLQGVEIGRCSREQTLNLT